jgi:hypothetical protein
MKELQLVEVGIGALQLAKNSENMDINESGPMENRFPESNQASPTIR